MNTQERKVIEQAIEVLKHVQVEENITFGPAYEHWNTEIKQSRKALRTLLKQESVEPEYSPNITVEPDVWASRIMCIGTEYGKVRYGKIPIQSIQEGYYSHEKLYSENSVKGLMKAAWYDGYTNLRTAIAELESVEPMAYAVINGDRVVQLSVTQDPFYPHSTPLFTHPASNAGELDLLRTQVRELRLHRDELQKHFDAQCTSADVLFDKLAACQKERDAAYSKQAEMCNITAEQTRQLASTEALCQQYREALEKLAKLGNGDYYGTSIGNCIAYSALALSSPTTALNNAIAEEHADLIELLEQATSYTCCSAYSPSLTREINAALAKVGEKL